MDSIKDTFLYQTLEKRERNRSTVNKYLGFIISVEEHISSFLSYQKIEFGDYPDHSIAHTIRIIQNIGLLLGEQKIEKLSSTELFCFILAAIFHDTGMTLTGYASKNELRTNHPSNASIVIDAFFDEYLKLLDNEKRIRKVVKYVCAAHGFDLNELYNGSEYNTVDTISTDKVRFGVLAVMLRIGDLLDLDDKRVSQIALLLLPEVFSEEAKSHNERHLHVERCRIEPDHLEIHVSAPDVSQYRIWKKWLGYLDEEIRFVNNEIANTGDGITYPKLEKSIITANGNYNIESLKFEIDENGGIFDVISTSIYTDKFDFVREIIQNAIDASLMLLYSDISKALRNCSPRTWGLTNTKYEIIIAYSEKKEMLFVSDCGTGMEESDLKSFLFKVSSTGYKKNRIRDYPFPAIAKFGIGFISCLINAKTIKIHTSTGSNSPLKMVTLESGLNEALMETIENTNQHGTVISIKLKYPFSYIKLKEYITKHIQYPSVGLSLVDLDRCELTCNNLGQTDSFNAMLQMPFFMKEIISDSVRRRESAVSPISAKISEYQQCLSQCDSLLNWLINNLNLDLRKSDNEKMKEFREIVNNISFPSEVQHEFPFKKRIGVKEFFNNPDEQERACRLFIEKLNDRIGSYRRELDQYPEFCSFIGSEHIEINKNWKYLVCYLDHDLKIVNAKYSNNPIRIYNESGILFLKHSYADFSLGIEYSAVIGFLFKDGVVQKRLSVMTGYHTILGETKPREISFEIGASGLTMQDLYDSVEDWKELQEYDTASEAFYDEDNNQELNIRPSFQTIFIDRQGIHFGSDDYDFNSLSSENAESDGCNIQLYCGSKRSNLSLFSPNYPVEDHQQLAKDEIDRIVSLKSAFFQDGIAVEVPLSWLFPNGYFRIICNATADARVKLNVSRHEPSRLDSDVTSWFMKVGTSIQKTLYKNVISMLDSVGLKHTFMAETAETRDDPFINKGLYSFMNLVKTEKQ